MNRGFWLSAFVGLLFLAGLKAVEAQAPAPVATAIKLPGLAATSNMALRVHRVPGASEIPAEFYGVDYPVGSVPTLSTSGFLTITLNGVWVAVWAPGQFSRIETVAP